MEFSANAHARVLAGEEVALGQDLELQPAAVIRGTVRRLDEELEAPASTLGGGLAVLPKDSETLAESLAAEYRATSNYRVLRPKDVK